MKKLFLIGFVCYWNVLHACTTFVLEDKGRYYFGRNYDWLTGAGAVHTNQRSLAKSSLQIQKSSVINWISKYGSITFNQYGKEFPTGGMNEKGLVVELMWLAGTKYAGEDQRPAIGVLQWIQYHLDNCETVEEVIATDIKLRIAQEAATPLHYLIADKKGNAATIEFLNGKMIVHKGNQLPYAVLTNSTYSASVAYAGPRLKNPGNSKQSNSLSSLDRFTTVCSMLAHFKEKKGISPVDYSFQMLKSVSQYNYTKWSIVYDMNGQKIYFKTASNPSLRHLSFSDFDFSCNQSPMAIDMNTDVDGNLKNQFQKYSDDLNQRIINEAVRATRWRIPIRNEAVEVTIKYPQTIHCN